MLFKICNIDIHFNDMVYHEHYVLETEKGLLLCLEQNHEDKRLSQSVIDILKNVKHATHEKNSQLSYSSSISISHIMPKMSKNIFNTRHQLKEHLISYDEASKEHTSLLWLYEDYMAGASLKQTYDIQIEQEELSHIFQQIEAHNYLKNLKNGWFIDLDLSPKLIDDIKQAEKNHISIMHDNLNTRLDNQYEYSSFRLDLLVNKLSKEYLEQYENRDIHPQASTS